MIKETIEYSDFNGVQRKEDFYFNLTKAEITELELGTEGGLSSMIEKVVAEQKLPKLIELFKEVIKKSYGKKSDDGRRFMKSEEIFLDFSQTEAYSILFMKLATDDKAAAAFMNGVIPNSK